MALILQIETTTASCSVSLSENGSVLVTKEIDERNIHASALSVFITEVMESAQVQMEQLSAVAVSRGPGSYTGLRIGVSMAKGICYALDIPLIAVDTLRAMAQRLITMGEYEGYLFCPMIDARRMEVYTALFDHHGQSLVDTEAKIIDGASFSTELEHSRVLFFGDGAMKCHELLGQSSNAVFIEDFTNSAADLTVEAWRKFESDDFEDVAYFEPYYLKDFIVGPKNPATSA